MIHCVASCTISCTSSLFSPSQGITIGKMDDLINNICKLLLHFAESKLRFFHVRHLVIVFLKNCLFSHTVRVNEVDSSQSTNMIRKEYKQVSEYIDVSHRVFLNSCTGSFQVVHVFVLGSQMSSLVQSCQVLSVM